MSASTPFDPELIQFVAARSGIDVEKAEAAVRSLVAFIEAKLATGEPVIVPGLGKFAIEKLKGGEARNPATGTLIKIDPYNKPVLLAAKSLKDAANQ